MFNPRGALRCAALILLLMSGFNSKKRKSGVTNRGGNSGSSTVPSTSRGTVDWPSGEGFTTESGGTFRPGGNPLNNKYTDLLDKLRGNSEFARLLQSLGFSEEDILSNTQKQDFNKQLVDQLLSYLTTQENRQYNEGLRDEQRLYDNPLNQLARLMGAGISRDAALQMLGGGSGSGSSAATPYSDPAAMMQGLSPSESALNEAQANLANLQGKLGIASTVLGGLGTISGLVNLGFSIPQAIHQTNILKAQSFMSQKSMLGLKAADSVLGAIENAVSIGALTTKDVDGFSNATDALNYINDHQDTNAFKGIFADGSFAQVYGTKQGREMFANAWNTVRQSKDAGTMLDQYIRRSELQNDLANMDVQKSYVEYNQAIYDLLMKDPQLLASWQDLYRSVVETEQEEFKRDILRSDAYYAGVQERINRRVFEDRAHGGISDESGIDILSFDQWWQLNKQFRKASVEFDHGKKYWEDFFTANLETAANVMFLKQNQSAFARTAISTEGPNPTFATIMQICKILMDSGAWDAIDHVMPHPSNITVDNGSKTFNIVK